MSEKLEELQLKVARLSRRTHELGIPIMVLFEGIPASGKTRLSNELLSVSYTHLTLPTKA